MLPVTLLFGIVLCQNKSDTSLDLIYHLSEHLVDVFKKERQNMLLLLKYAKNI